MSRIGRLGLLAALLLTPGKGAAQQTEEQFLQRLDSLRPLLEAVTEEFRLFERDLEERKRIEAAAQAEVDTLRVGMMTIITPVDQAVTARELFSEVWEEYYSHILRSPGLETTVFAFQWANDLASIHVVRNRRELEYRGWVRRSHVRDQIREAIGVSVTADLSTMETVVGDWVSGEPHREHDPAQIYRQLATTRSIATRGCVDGDVDSCLTALGLGIDGNPIEQWYTPEERRSMVGSRAHLAALRSSSDAWEACIHHSDVQACDGLLRGDRGRWAAPLPGSARASLLSLALERGGRGAWSRILEDPSISPEAALERASGLPLPTLVGEWRAWVVENRPDVYGQLGPKSGIALVWTLLFAALAMRSTRWRLG